MASKPTIPEVIDRFRTYHQRHPAWGALHIVLDDQNADDGSVRHCMDRARETADEEGHALAEILLTMSRTQRLKLASLA